MIVVKALERPLDHRISKLMRACEHRNPYSQRQRYAEVYSPPGHLVSEPDQAGSDPSNRPFLGSGRRFHVKVDASRQVKHALWRSRDPRAELNYRHQSVRIREPEIPILQASSASGRLSSVSMRSIGTPSAAASGRAILTPPRVDRVTLEVGVTRQGAQRPLGDVAHDFRRGPAAFDPRRAQANSAPRSLGRASIPYAMPIGPAGRRRR